MPGPRNYSFKTTGIRIYLKFIPQQTKQGQLKVKQIQQNTYEGVFQGMLTYAQASV
jgi:hypothetical protein